MRKPELVHPCPDCGGFGWVQEMETPEVKTWVPCYRCVEKGRATPERVVYEHDDKSLPPG